jgi:hypothetical protein
MQIKETHSHRVSNARHIDRILRAANAGILLPTVGH